MNASYLKFLKFVVAMAYYGSIAALIFVGIMLTLELVRPINKFLISVEIPFSLAKSIAFDEPDWTIKLGPGTDSRLTFTSFTPAAVQNHASLYISVVLSILLGLVLTIFGIRQIKNLVDTLGTPSVFSQANVVRIRWLGGLLIVAQFIQPLVWLLVRNDVLTLLNRNGIKYSNESIGFGVSGLTFAGLLILGLAEVFHSGYQLKQESELTI